MPRGPDDLAAILYTSGTTGRSKGAMLSHDNLASNALVLKDYWRWQAGDVLIHALPIYHVHGLFVALHGALLNGSTMLWHKGFDADAVLADLASATILMGVPTFYVRLAAHPGLTREAAAGMRLFVSGSAPLLEATFADFEAKTGHRILERYGMTEAGMICSNPYDGERIPGTVGFPLPGVEARIEAARDRACWRYAGPNLFKGYWRNRRRPPRRCGRRLLHHRRHRDHGRGRPRRHRRAGQGPDHRRRPQHLSEGDRAGDRRGARASARAR